MTNLTKPSATGLPDVPGHYWRITYPDYLGEQRLQLVKGKPRSRWLAWLQEVVGSQILNAPSYNSSGAWVRRTITGRWIKTCADEIASAYEKRKKNRSFVGNYPPKSLAQ